MEQQERAGEHDDHVKTWMRGKRSGDGIVIHK